MYSLVVASSIAEQRFKFHFSGRGKNWGIFRFKNVSVIGVCVCEGERCKIIPGQFLEIGSPDQHLHK